MVIFDITYISIGILLWEHSFGSSSFEISSLRSCEIRFNDQVFI